MAGNNPVNDVNYFIEKRGIRHAYGLNAIVNNIPLNMLQKWMGHADIKTTAIYADAIGEAEQDLANRMWD